MMTSGCKCLHFAPRSLRQGLTLTKAGRDVIVNE